MTEREAITMHIGELAERTGLSLRTIRHYDDVGLLPATARTEGGFRLYTEADHERLLTIMAMKPLGFSLEEMAEMLSLLPALTAIQGNVCAATTERLEFFRNRATHQREKMIRNLAAADQFIASFGG
ncbi:MerR family transcriptional regulator [Arthrobacter psychrochitiniphilus]|uniref:MerR family transcriptional regulator n=1 Tax=Arthrobacter psychrochitiniphilus TaxID=291045 RepID=UPI003F7C2387